MSNKRYKRDLEVKALIDSLVCPRMLAIAEREVKEALAKAGRRHQEILYLSQRAPRRVMRKAA